MKWPWISWVLVAGGCMSPSRAADGPAAFEATSPPAVEARVANAPEVRPEPAADPRLVVFSGSLCLQVPDVELAERDARRIAGDAKGWLHRASGSTLTLRVPAAAFAETIEKLSKLGRLIDRRIEGTDVTEEYRDLEIRIRNAEAVRARLTKLLESAKDVKESLEVERELSRLTDEIERMKGRLQRMSDQVAFSTIVVDLRSASPSTPARRVSPTSYPFPWLRRLGLDALTRIEE